MQQRLDTYFSQHDRFPRIAVEDGFQFIEYRSYEAAHRMRVWSEQNFIVLVLQGQKRIETGTGRYELDVDQALFLRKGAYVMSEVPLERGVFQSALFFIDDAFMERFARRHSDLLPRHNRASAAPAIALQVSAPIAQFYHAALPYFNTPLNEARRRGLALKFEELLLNLIALPENEGFALYLNGLLQDKPSIPSVMEQNFRLRLSLQGFAKLAQRSLSAFKRDFKAAYDIPPAQWLRERRLKQAAHLLEHTGLPVTQIALESGFEDASHFSHAFRNYFQCSPTDYRQRAAEPKQ
jgi:AraC family transcriptional regulator, exoenzyme S synthesis regulatory protein ExsA